MNLQNKSNQYQKLLKEYDKIPKAVLAAIAVSYALLRTDEDFEKVEEEIKREWAILHQNGIVPQKPIR